ncbi:hypothetical protein LPB136_04325 [Tenacibaculum todarodis]|uniref:Uncharacterized protein n=1 Tax=Tenacibaculum todarodis TaxID=1850252 RepID=A0A1L3JHN5_9FLAO|nr:hypothetical protein [Tenacibaculum todarodis]APG64638.1 hypothetical protein LPB136_04325 [Tenacibaculum todarodis]
MRVIKLNVNANLIDVSNNKDSGKIREYIDLGVKSKKQADLIISLAGTISEKENEFVGIETKYLFGKRDKRFEIVFKKDKIINIIKISKQKKFDKDAIELDIIISDMAERYNLTVNGIVLLTDHFDLVLTEKYSTNLKNSIEIVSYNKFKEKYVISNK